MVLEYLLSWPQLEHSAWPAFENFPAVHFTAELEPSAQKLPAEQEEHAVRVCFDKPPDVNDPGGQMAHAPAPLALWALSLPHTVQSWLPLGL